MREKQLTHYMEQQEGVGQEKDDLAKDDVSMVQTTKATIEEKIRRNGTGKYTVRPVKRESVANRLLYFSAWSCRTGKRIRSS
jgi:hypothetical protein